MLFITIEMFPFGQLSLFEIRLNLSERNKRPPNARQQGILLSAEHDLCWREFASWHIPVRQQG